MGQYVVPTDRVHEAVMWLGPTGGVGWSWSPAEGGVLFTAPNLSDTEAAALYEGFVRYPGVWPPLPEAVRTHTQHLRDYLAKDPAMITNAESVHVIKDLIRAVYLLNNRLENE